MIVGVLTTCHTQYTRDRGICIVLFNRTTLQVFVTYLTGALYLHPLWFYKHQHDNRVRSKLSVACQRWSFQWRFWFVPSVPGYLREEEEHKPDPWRNPIERNHMGLHLENEVARRVVKTPPIISNNPVYDVQSNLVYAIRMAPSVNGRRNDGRALPIPSHKTRFLFSSCSTSNKHLQLIWQLSYATSCLAVYCTLSPTKIHRPDISHLPLRQSRDVQLPS